MSMFMALWCTLFLSVVSLFNWDDEAMKRLGRMISTWRPLPCYIQMIIMRPTKKQRPSRK